LARGLLDKAYREFLNGLSDSPVQDFPATSVAETKPTEDSRIPSPLSLPESVPSSTVSSPQEIFLESPGSSLDTIIFESPPSSPNYPSYSPVSSSEPTRPPSPAHCTSSVEFIEEFPSQQRDT